MIEWIIVFGKAIITAIVCAGVYSILTEYWEEAKSAFKKAWITFKRLLRATGVLVRRGKKLFKLFVVQTLCGEYETYEDGEDMGVEIEWEDLSPEAKQALKEDDFLVVEHYVTL